MGNLNFEIAVDRDLIVKHLPTILTIQAHELYSHQGEPGEQELNNFSSINNGISIAGYGQSKKHFESEVFIGKKAKWIIQKSDPFGIDQDYELRLISVISKDPSSTFFDENPLYVNQNNEIEAKVSKGAVESIFNYSINFLISNKAGYGIKVYTLDPELRMVPTI